MEEVQQESLRKTYLLIRKSLVVMTADWGVDLGSSPCSEFFQVSAIVSGLLGKMS